MIFNYGFLFGFVLCFVCVSVRWDVPPLNQNSLDTVCGMLSTKLIHWCIVVDDNTITICIRPTKNRMSFAVKPAAGIENSLSMFCLVLDQSYPKKKKNEMFRKYCRFSLKKKTDVNSIWSSGLFVKGTKCAMCVWHGIEITLSGEQWIVDCGESFRITI